MNHLQILACACLGLVACGGGSVATGDGGMDTGAASAMCTTATADCMRSCESAKSMGCAPPTADCTNQCVHDLETPAMAAGCCAQFAALAACQAGAPCDTSHCTTQDSALHACMTAPHDAGTDAGADAGHAFPACAIDYMAGGVCSGTFTSCPGSNFGTVRCADGHAYSSHCTTTAGVCSCSCTLDGSDVAGTECTTASVTVGCGTPFDGGTPFDAGVCMLTAAGCGPSSTSPPAMIDCTCATGCPSFLPRCQYGHCSSGDWGGELSCGDAGAPVDAGPPCSVHADCAVDAVCMGGHCAAQLCRTTSECPSGYTCPSGNCIRS